MMTTLVRMESRLHHIHSIRNLLFRSHVCLGEDDKQGHAQRKSYTQVL